MSDIQEKARILICEDEVLIAADLASRLKGLGCTVCGQAASVEATLELVEKHQPDLVMMDIVLQGEMDGIDAAEVIKDKWGSPVVFLIAYAEIDRFERAKLTCPFGYLLKPFQDRDLKITVEMALYVAKVDAERLSMQEELKNVNQQLSATIEAIPDLMFEVDGEGRIFSYHVPNFHTLYTSPNKFLGKLVSQVLPDDAAKVIMSAIAEANETGRHEGAIYKLDLPQGENWFELSIAAKGDHKDPNCRFLALARDVTTRKQAEEMIRESERRYRELIYNIQAAIVLHGSDTRIISCNSKAQELLGLTEDQMLGKAAMDPDWKFFKPDGENLNLSEYPVNKVLATRQPLKDMVGGIYRPQKDDFVWVLVNADPVFDDENNIQQVVVIFMDITDQKLTEKALRDSESFLSATGKIAKVGGWELDIGTHEIKWTEQTYRIFELPVPSKPLDETAVNFIHPDDRERVSTAVQRASDQGIPFDLEHRIITAKGNKLWVRSICNPQIVNGKVVKLMGVFQDITELKQAEIKLQESEKRYRSIIELSPLGMGMVNPEGVIVDANRALASMLGYDVKDLIGMTFKEITHPDDLKKEIELLQPVWDDEEISYTLEKRYRHKDGHYFWVSITAAKMIGNYGEEAYLFGFVENITERKQMELEREKLITELKNALAEIKELRGFLPICANCKKIRDDAGYWQQVDEYIQDRTDAQFSHSICPECMKALYPEIAGRILNKTKE